MISILLMLAIPSQVRHCQTAATYQQSVSYSTPVYQQSYNYTSPYVEKSLFVVTPDIYYANLVGQQVRAELKAKANLEADADLATKVGQLSDAVSRLAAKIDSNVPDTNPVPDPVPVPVPVPAPNANPVPPAPTPAIPATPTPTVPANPAPTPNTTGFATKPNDKVLALFKKDCMKCHTSPSNAGGGFSLFNSDQSFANLKGMNLIAIDDELYHGSMPKGGQPYKEEYSDVRFWIAENSDLIRSEADEYLKWKGLKK